MIALGFLTLILLGSVLLTLPVASATGRRIPWFDALFTSTSAVCVTGLVVRDTGTAYSAFGHVVLMLLIEAGGLGLMTFTTLLFRLLGRGFSMRDRMIMQESLNQDDLGGVVDLVMWVARSAFVVQFTGAVLFSIRLIPIYGAVKGLFFSVFHAISAFCNAGFDLFGGGASLTGFSGDLLINLTAIALVVSGGIGFGTVHDILKKRRFSKRRLRKHFGRGDHRSPLLTLFFVGGNLNVNNGAPGIRTLIGIRQVGNLAVQQIVNRCRFQRFHINNGVFENKGIFVSVRAVIVDG
jgi:trk system potassium uptake protein TrkH